MGRMLYVYKIKTKMISSNIPILLNIYELSLTPEYTLIPLKDDQNIDFFKCYTISYNKHNTPHKWNLATIHSWLCIG